MQCEYKQVNKLDKKVTKLSMKNKNSGELHRHCISRFQQLKSTANAFT